MSREYQADIEDELIAGVRWRDQAGRIAKDAVARMEKGDGKRTKCLAGNDGRGYGREMDQWLRAGFR